MPEFIFVRHAVALDRVKAAADGVTDKLRPLTERGSRDFRRHTLKNKKIFQNVDLWVTSSYVRARETLDTILDALKTDEAHINIAPRLSPGAKPQKLEVWIKKRSERKIVFISHEPFLSAFLTRVLKPSRPLPKLKKGAIVVIDYNLKNRKYKLKELINP